MEDPFASLLKSLQPIFHLEAMRNGKYVFPPIQALKEATEQYNPQNKVTFILLLKTITDSRSYIEKWRVNFDDIINCMNHLAKKHGMPTIEWDVVLRHQGGSPRFQFGDHSSDEESLIPWLTNKTGKHFNQLNYYEKTQILVDNSYHNGFSNKLSAHLKKHPDFLFRLIMESESNFTKISSTRLNLYLTDSQIATAIIKHAPHLIKHHTDAFIQVEQLVNKLNEILANGRSVNTLLRNTEARTILDASKLFQIYQSEEYKNRQQSDSIGGPNQDQDNSNAPR